MSIVLSFMAIVAVLFFGACNDEIEVQQEYDFALNAWHLQEEISPGEEVEIRITLRRQRNFKGAHYDIGYVQMQGEGEVYDMQGTRLVNREKEPLRSIAGLDDSDPCSQVFTLFYRSSGEKKSELLFFIVDNFGQRRELTISFEVS